MCYVLYIMHNIYGFLLSTLLSQSELNWQTGDRCSVLWVACLGGSASSVYVTYGKGRATHSTGAEGQM